MAPRFHKRFALKSLPNVLGCLRWLHALICVIVLPSCIEREATLFVNPDGSGKIIVVLRELKGKAAAASVTRAIKQSYQGRHGIPPDIGMDTFLAAQFVGATQGVEEWTNFRSEKDGEGYVTVFLRGYFRDINKLKIGGFERAEEPGAVDEPPTVSMTTNSDGDQTFHLPNADPVAFFNAVGLLGEDDRPLAGDEIAQAIAVVRKQAASVKAMGGGGIERMQLKITIQPSGKISDFGGFREAEGNQAFCEVTGSRMLDLLDLLGSDDQICQSLATRQQFTDEKSRLVRAKFVGAEKPCKLTAAKSVAQFDYQAEIGAARANASPEIRSVLDMVEKFEGIKKVDGINLFGRKQ